MRKKYENIANNKYGRLTVINPNIKEGKYYFALCKCDCGNTKIVRRDHLVSGAVQSCGCLHRENGRELGKARYEFIAGANRIDIKNKRFGKLTAIELLKEGDRTHSEVWLCKCDCGAYQEVLKNNLLRNHTCSCGCINSSLEVETAKLLSDNGIKFTKNKTFSDCKFEQSGALARFDFYVEDRYVIECDGQQHIKENWQMFGVPSSEIKKKDAFKNKWCFDKGIPIIRIPYTQKGKLEIFDLKPETSKYLLKGVVVV